MVNFMRKIPSKIAEYVFIWPDIKDECSVPDESVKTILPNPKELRRARYSFDEKHFTLYKLIK